MAFCLDVINKMRRILITLPFVYFLCIMQWSEYTRRDR